MADVQKPMSVEEMRRVVLGYRGKSENLNLNKVKKQGSKPKDEKRGPKLNEIPKPKLIQANITTTPQRNDSIITKAIFGQDVSVTPIDPRQNFSANYSQLPLLAREVYDQYYADNPMIDRQLIQVEMVY